MIMLIILLLMLYEVHATPEGTCSEYDSSGKEIWFCCNNHEQVNGICIECVNGFESLDGSPCRPCPKGLFGRECIKICDCNITKCNHIQGCINIEHKWIEEKKESSIPMTSSPTLRDYNDNWLTTITLYVISGRTSTAMTSTRRLTRTTPKSTANTLGLNSREIIVYSTGAGIFALFILMCSVCKHRYKQICEDFKRYQTSNRRRINITENPQLEIPLEEIEGVYEEIDEANVIDNVNNAMDNIISVSGSDSSYVQPDSNNYLTPYQPSDEDETTNTLNDKKSESSESPNAHNQHLSNHESSSLSSYVIERRSSYLNPHQPIAHSPTYSIYDSGSSGSDTLPRESDYLNPYQPMVQEMNFHEYKSILKSSDGSGSSLSDTCTKEVGVKFPYLYQDLTLDIDTHEYK